jgi:hypothetical protein
MLFREGIRPEWEDPENEGGGHLEYALSTSSVSSYAMDHIWNNVVLSMVSGELGGEKNLVTGRTC